MSRSTRSIPAAEFKAQCLALLDDVAERGDELVVTKHGVPVARIVPVLEKGSPRSLRGSVLEESDLVSPIDEAWDASR